jgi:hypothetical protein
MFIMNLFLQDRWLTTITTGRFWNIWRNKPAKNIWNVGRTRTRWFSMTAHQWTLLYQCSNITWRFCNIWGNKLPKMYEMMVNQDWWQCAHAHFFVIAAILAH